MSQLSIFDLSLPEAIPSDAPLEIGAPAPPPPPVNPHLQTFLEVKAQVYLELMGQIVRSQLSPAVKRHESTRLYQIRQEALDRLDSLDNP